MANVPNQYHLHGGGISVSYYPDGFGPVLEGRGSLRLVYQDAHQSKSFYDADVRSVVVDDVGTVVSVTLVITVDVGSTTFSFLVPTVQLPGEPSSVFIHTKGITTLHKLFLAPFVHPQKETYTVTALRGTAAVGSLPL